MKIYYIIILYYQIIIRLVAENIALEQFRINMMNQGGSGLETGASSGASFQGKDGLFSELNPPSIEGMKKNIQTSFGKLFESLLNATKGSAGQFTLTNLGFLKSMPPTPQSNKKVPAGLVSPSRS